MKKEIQLPGLYVSRASIFDLDIGNKVYDKVSGKVGVISSIRETTADWVEAFIKFDGEEDEVSANSFPGLVLL